jgi:hypothetical protein
MKNRYQTIQTFIQEIFKEGIKNGEFRSDLDYESITSLLFATLEGLGLQYATLGIQFESQRLKEVLLKLVFEGIQN